MVSKLVKNYYKYISNIMNIKISSHSFHTARIPVLPNTDRREKESNAIDYLQCLRPAELPVCDGETLAGNPRMPGRYGQGIEPAVFQKWNRSPKMEVPKDWSCFVWCDRQGK